MTGDGGKTEKFGNHKNQTFWTHIIPENEVI